MTRGDAEPAAVSSSATRRGTVVAIHTTATAGAPMEAHDRIAARAGGGLAGDRYDAGSGHWSAARRSGDGLTIIAAEVLDDLERQQGIVLRPGDTRRNITTRGVDLEALIGSTFTIGTVSARGVRRCEPCSYLDGLLGQELLYHLVHRAGIRAEILTDGEIAVGDPITRPGDDAVAHTEAGRRAVTIR
jgi:MOSC domain-containing protein YiiM